MPLARSRCVTYRCCWLLTGVLSLALGAAFLPTTAQGADAGRQPSPEGAEQTSAPPLLELRADFTDKRLTDWRHKENAQLEITVEGANPALRLTSQFTPFQFTWTTWSFPPHTAVGTAHVQFRIRGDGSGHRLRVQLGTRSDGRTIYFVNNDQSPKLDFQGWRTFFLDLDRFETPANALRQRDLAAVTFIEFMVIAEGKTDAKPAAVDVLLDDVAFVGPTAEELAMVQRQLERCKQLREQAQPRLAAIDRQLATIAAELNRVAKEGRPADEARVYLAALRWLAGDVQRMLAADEVALVEQATGLLDSLAARAGEPQRIMSHVSQRPNDEVDPLDVAHNPYFTAIADLVSRQSRKERTWPKGRAGYDSINNAWEFAGLGNSVFETVWVATRPKSPLRHEAMAITNALNLLDTIAHQHTAGDFNINRTAVFGHDGNINRFCLAPALDAWILLKTNYPDLLPPAKQADIEAGLKVLADYQVKDYGLARLAKEPHVKFPTYLNMDVHHVLIMEFARRLWGETPYAAERDAFLQGVMSAVYPDGAWPYINTQNECFVYHHLNVTFLARYWKLNSDPNVLATLRKTIPFFPDNVEPAGMPEYYTDPCWKHYWAGGAPQGPEVIAGLFDDGPNKRVAERAAEIWGYSHGYMTAIAAEFWKPIPARPQKDGYVRFDRNIEGPRGRYGAWSFAGNGRNYQVGYQGKDTFVGAMITDPAAKPMPMDSALQLVTAEIRSRPDGNHWNGAVCFSAVEKLTTAMGPDFGSLAVRYTVSKPNWHHKNDELFPWDGTQEWYLSKDRLIGRVALEATADDSRAAVLGRIRLGMSLKAEPDGENAWRYGRMRIKLHAHNYDRVETRPSETFYQDKPDKYRSTEITLVDPLSEKAGEKGTVKYLQGTRYWFLVEVYPDDSSPAADVRLLKEGEATGFMFRDAARRVALLHNPTEQIVRVAWPFPGAAERFQVYSKHDGHGEAIAKAPTQLTLGPQQHVVVVGQ